MLPKHFHIVLFDGECNLCDGTVRFLIRNDKKKLFRFIALQSDLGKELIKVLNLNEKESNSVAYINYLGVYTKSTAVLNTLKFLDKWSFLSHLLYIPGRPRDIIYDMVAKSRFKIFGRKEYCEVPEDIGGSRFALSKSEFEQLKKFIE
ncbi:MAG: DUF393 domain-containing protein [Bacteroidales bacterium]|nr:DUF393 domain-containing protein [Bacteroidales bacterium]